MLIKESGLRCSEPGSFGPDDKKLELHCFKAYSFSPLVISLFYFFLGVFVFNDKI